MMRIGYYDKKTIVVVLFSWPLSVSHKRTHKRTNQEMAQERERERNKKVFALANSIQRSKTTEVLVFIPSCLVGVFRYALKM